MLGWALVKDRKKEMKKKILKDVVCRLGESE